MTQLQAFLQKYRLAVTVFEDGGFWFCRPECHPRLGGMPFPLICHAETLDVAIEHMEAMLPRAFASGKVPAEFIR